MTLTKIPPGVIWLTGITASGKTTLGEALYNGLSQKITPEKIKFLDGDKIRNKLKKGYGHTIEDRFASLKDLVQVAKSYYDHGNIVIVSTISYKREMRSYARNQMQNFMEVFLDCSIKICAQRDIKGHYKRAFAGEYETFIGVTEDYETSLEPELTITTDNKSIGECYKILFEEVNKFFNLKI